MGKQRVFIDSSMFKGLVDEADDFHTSAVTLWDRLKIHPVTLVTSNFIIDETFTLIRSRRGLQTSLRFRDILKSKPHIIILRVAVMDEQAVWNWFLKDWSKLSFTDCVCFAQMKRLGISRVATFDDHFSRAGFQVEASS